MVSFTCNNSDTFHNNSFWELVSGSSCGYGDRAIIIRRISGAAGQLLNPRYGLWFGPFNDFCFFTSLRLLFKYELSYRPFLFYFLRSLSVTVGGSCQNGSLPRVISFFACSLKYDLCDFFSLGTAFTMNIQGASLNIGSWSTLLDIVESFKQWVPLRVFLSVHYFYLAFYCIIIGLTDYRYGRRFFLFY